MDRGRALDGAERETDEAVRERFPGGGVQRSAPARRGRDPQAESGRLRASRASRAG